MEEFKLIEFKVSDKYYGVPQPYIPDNTIVILVQGREVKFSKYREPTDDDPIPKFEHPNHFIENKELENLILDIIKEQYPQYFLSEIDVVITCPSQIAEKIVW